MGGYPESWSQQWFPKMGTAMTGKKFDAPICAGMWELTLTTCSTCCCKDGLITNGISSAEIAKNHPDCGLWFVFADWLVRAIQSWMRSMRMLLDMKTCLSPGCTEG